MKRFANVLALAALLLSIAPSGTAAGDPGKPKRGGWENVRDQITLYLQSPDMSAVQEKEVESVLHFYINDRDEIVVIQVDTDSEFADRYLKDQLNYKRLKGNDLKGQFAMKITLKNTSS